MKPKLKLKVRTRYLASIFDGVGITIRRDGLAAYPDLDFTPFAPITIFNPSDETVLVQNTDGSFSKVALDTLINLNNGSRRVITAAGNVTVDVNDGLIILKKTVAEDTDFLLPPDVGKIGPVKIIDWNEVGDTKLLRAVPSGSETINNQATWQIGKGASIVLTPTGAGLGYAV